MICAADDEAHLARLADGLEARGVELVRIHEDRAPYDGQLMSIGIPPGRKEVVGRYFRGMPLLPPD